MLSPPNYTSYFKRESRSINHSIINYILADFKARARFHPSENR
jgi:hypothetical protein